LQKDVADKIGIDRSTYIHYESITHNLYPRDKLKKLANLFGVNIKKLLDDYNLFLYSGQGKQIKALRNRLGLTVSKFAKLYNTTHNTVRNWENNKVIIFKSSWERLFNKT
jgi:transcriptional regulator with XRE-family HTH domain